MGKQKGRKITAVIVAAILFIAALIYCNQVEKVELVSTGGQSYEKAVVKQIIVDNLQEDGERYGNQEVILEIKTGPMAGREMRAISPNGTLFGAACEVGMKVIAIVNVSEDTSLVTVYSQDRTAAIYGFVLFFALVVCLVGGKKGAKAMICLAFDGIAIFYILFPLVYRGCSPVWVTVFICVLATLFMMMMIGGVTSKTVSATVGTTCGVVAAGLSALIFGHFAGISGYNVSDIETLNYIAQQTPIRIGELLFSGIILSALGAVMDVGMSISSTIQELYETNPSIGKKQLFLSGIHVGRDVMGTMVDTLILAYAGGALSTLVTNYAYDLSYNQLINSYIVGVEIMQGVAGSLGIVLTVPITAVVSVELIYRRKKKEEKTKELDAIAG